MISFVFGGTLRSISVYLSILLIFHHDFYDEAQYPLFSGAKEIEPTKEWQPVEGDDTIPAGMHVRIDLTTGEKWVKDMNNDIYDSLDENQNDEDKYKGVHKNAAGLTQNSLSTAVLETRGDVNIEEHDVVDDRKKSRNSTKYNFEMMYRTLSKLPPEEIESMGGLPERPDFNNSSRKSFEESMLKIWEKRQAELLDVELNLPAILKARIAGIKIYLENPEMQLKYVNLDAHHDNDVVTDILSLLKDLEFQLSDIDMARDFHTMNGWPLLVRLLLEESHVPAKKTVHDLSPSTITKIRTIQSYAAWAIGTAVKNTEEFSPYGVESVILEDMRASTAIDLLIDIFCDEYEDSSSWEIRTLLTKCIYAIGAILRGNEVAQTLIAKTSGFNRLGQKYSEFSQQGFNSANTKLIQRMVGLWTDIVQEILLHSDISETKTYNSIVETISSIFCDNTCDLFSSEKFIPVVVQETLVKAISVMAPHCQESTCAIASIRSIVESVQSDWSSNQNLFDSDHFQELLHMASDALESLGSETD